MARDDTLHHQQHRRDQLGLHGQKHAQRDWQRQYRLRHRHARVDVVRPARRETGSTRAACS
jgi:hypothetical protein